MSDQSANAAMEKAIDESLAEDGIIGVAPMPRAAQLKPVERREPTLLEQVQKMEQIEGTLRNRIRREQLSMQHEFEHRAVELRNGYERKIHDAITNLERQRDAELQALTEDYNSKTREHELLTKRMG